MSEHALLKEAVASTIDSFDDEELSNLKNHTYIQSCSNKSIELLCITDSLTGRLASEIVYIGNLRDRIDETKENLKNRTSFYRKLIEGRLSTASTGSKLESGLTPSEPSRQVVREVGDTAVKQSDNSTAPNTFGQNAHNGITKPTTLEAFNGDRPHGWFYVKEKSEDEFHFYLCVLWNNLILYLFDDESIATHFFSSKMDSTTKEQRFIDLTMGINIISKAGKVKT